MKKIIYSIIFLILSFAVKISAQDDLSRYLTTAAENNTSLKVKFNEYMAMLERIPQVAALPDPSIAFGYFIQPVETKSGPQQAKISATQMFPWFGTRSSLKNSVAALAKAKYEIFEEAKSKLFYDIKSSYYDLYFNQQAIKITNENIKILYSFKGLAKIKIESGTASSLDIYRVQMEINDLKNQLSLLKNNAHALSVKFNSYLNIDTNSPINIAENLKELTYLDKQDILTNIRINNHSLNAFDYQIEELRHRQKVATKEGLPRFSVGIDYSFIGKGDNTASNRGQDAIMFPMIGFTIPLYRGKYKAKVQEVKYLQTAKANEKIDKENTLIVLFENIWKEYQDALSRTKLYQEQKELAEKSLSILETEYANNNINFEEILRMERQRLKYSLEKQKATADREAAIAFIQYLQGK